jgi:hypothetical protein
LFERRKPIAFAVYQLLLDFPSWVHRRTERIEVISDDRVVRHVTVDFTAPDIRFWKQKRETLVPLSLLRKGLLVGFDLTDESGRALPMLTRSDNSRLSLAMLLAHAGIVVERELLGLQDLSPSVRTDLADVVEADLQAAVAAVSRFERFTSLQHYCIWRDEDALRPLISALSENFVMYVLLDAEPGERRIIKFSYEDDLPQREEGAPSGAVRRQRLVLPPLSYRLSLPMVSAAASYHIEVRSPERIGIGSAVFTIPRPETELEGATELSRTIATDSSTDDPLDELLPLKPSGLPPAAVGLDTVHMYVTQQPAGSVGVIEFAFVPRPEGFLPEALAMTAIAAAVFAGGLLAYALHWHRLPEASAALLVAVPGVFAGWLAQAAEHRLVQQLALTLRLLVLGVAGASFVAGATLVVSMPSAWRVSLWAAAFSFSVIAGARICLTWLYVRRAFGELSTGKPPTHPIVPLYSRP